METRGNWVPAVVLYCTSSAGALILLLLNLAGDAETANAFVGVLAPVEILAVIFSAFLLLRCWKALPEAHRKTTPGKAVGFLFISFYNSYRLFVSFPALAKRCHSYGKQVNDPEMKDMNGLGITYAALFVLQLMLVFLGGAIGASRAALDGVTLAASSVEMLSPLPSTILIVAGIPDVAVFVLFFKRMSTYANRALSRSASAPPTTPSPGL